ncbi:MAG: NAD-binding protein [Spirochaetes bacterium]|nr:NAD-binding protein [Spirochaetota bacterium]
MKIYRKIRFTIILVLAVICIILLLNLLVYLEKDAAGSSIRTFADALWYAVVTLTTVGYGDTYPVSASGRLIGYFFVICSLGFLGFLISKLTDVFINIREKRKMGLFGSKFKNHIVIIGWDDFSKSIVEQLINAGNRVAIVCKKKDDLELIRENYDEKQVFVLFSDYDNLENLKKVKIEAAYIIFVNLDNDTEKLVYILNMKKNFGNLKFLITLDNASLKDTFYTAGVDYILSRNEVAAKLVASYIFEPDVAKYNADLLSATKKDSDFDVQQYRVTPKNPFVNSSYGDAFFSIKKNYDSILIGLSKKRKDNYELLKNPPDDTVIENNDYLIVITNFGAEKLLRQAFGTREGILDHV